MNDGYILRGEKASPAYARDAENAPPSNLLKSAAQTALAESHPSLSIPLAGSMANSGS